MLRQRTIVNKTGLFYFSRSPNPLLNTYVYVDCMYFYYIHTYIHTYIQTNKQTFVVCQTSHTWPRTKPTDLNIEIESNSKTTTDQLLQLSRFDDQSHHGKTDQSKPRQRHEHNPSDEDFSLWRWVPLRQLKRQSPPTDFLKTSYSQTITLTCQTTDTPGFQPFTT